MSDKPKCPHCGSCGPVVIFYKSSESADAATLCIKLTNDRGPAYYEPF